jgi:hypothetical protein
MTTPVEVHFGTKALAWAKGAFAQIFAIGKRVATLEARVTALEQALGKQPPDACPFCGERAMRMIDAGFLLGEQGKQWWEDVWTCEKCAKRQVRYHKLQADRR